MTGSSQVVDQAAHALKNSPHFELRRLQLNGSDGTLVITGKVSCYYHKQLAQETIKALRGNFRLDNRVYVEVV
jgi:hypothetical protein